MLEGDHVWQDGSTAAAYSVTAAGTYHVTITDGACQWTDTMKMRAHATPFLLPGRGHPSFAWVTRFQLDAYSGAEATYVSDERDHRPNAHSILSRCVPGHGQSWELFHYGQRARYDGQLLVRSGGPQHLHPER